MTGSYVIGSAISTYVDEKVRAAEAAKTVDTLEIRIQNHTNYTTRVIKNSDLESAFSYYYFYIHIEIHIVL